MKKLAFLFLLSFFVNACEKEEKLPPNPEWLNSMITQFENSQLPGIVIYAYKWNEEYYYYVSNPISSCMYCEVYDYAGVKITFDENQFQDFITNAKRIKAVWEKGF